MYRGSFVRLVACCAFALTSLPLSAAAGGSEYPSDGTRGLGRGGASMTRADNPKIMVRNPALLADLWGSMLYMNVNVGFPEACSQPSGGYGWGELGTEVLQLDPNGEPVKVTAEEGAVGGSDPDNLQPVMGYEYEPYPEVCYESGTTIAPSVALTGKFGDKLGLGIGFMPPEIAMDTQYGNNDGTVDTPNGLRPNPMRYMDTGRAPSYFGLLGAFGYRIVPWLRVGAGFRWSMVHADVTAWNKYGTPDLSPANDLRIHYYGTDMFVPGFTASVHAVPIDALDIAVGFRWEDRPTFNDAKLDIEVNPWGTGETYYFRESPGDAIETYAVDPAYMNYNVPGKVVSPPVSVPQLSLGIRFADRIVPRPENYAGFSGGTDPVRDSMSEERWDIEFNFIYYFNSTFDELNFEFVPSERITRVSTDEAGAVSTISGPPGVCPDNDGDGSPDSDPSGNCLVNYVMPAKFGGNDQISMRLGGDYNIIPDVFAVRAGVSYEGRGADPDYTRPPYGLPFERLGLHTGFTWRLDGRTDLTFAFAHFFQETIELALNTDPEASGMDLYLRRARTFNPDARPGGYSADPAIAEQQAKEVYHVIDEADADGVGRQRTGDNTYYVNAGTHAFSLNVIGASIARHF